MGRIDTYPSGSTIVPITASLLGYAEVTANQGSITTEVDLTGLSVTVTVPGGRRIRITGSTWPTNSAADSSSRLLIKEGATVLQTRDGNIGAAASAEGLSAEVVITPSAGTHTYKLAMNEQTGAGTVTNNASTTFPSFIMVEDITGSQLATTPAQFVPVGQLGYGQRTANQTGIGTTPVLIGGLSVNVSVQAGRQIKITGFLPTFTKTSGAPTWVRAYIRRSGTDVQRTIESATNDVFTALTVEHVESPAAGSYTYEIYCDTDTGTVALDLGSIGTGANAFILVEDVTPTPTPAAGAPASTLGYAEKTTSQTGITGTETTVTDLSVAVTIPAGRRIRVKTSLHTVASAADNGAQARIKDNGTEIQFDEEVTPTAGSRFELTPERIYTPSAGLHTYTVTIARTVGAGTIDVSGFVGDPSWLLVEDVTGSVWPAGSVVTYGLVGSEEWTGYTPTLSQGVTTDIAKTVQYSRYVKIGRMVTWQFRIGITGTGTASSTIALTLPFTPASVADTIRVPVGTGQFFNSSANTFHPLLPTLSLNSGSTLVFTPAEASVGLGSQFFGLSVMTEAVANNDVLSGTITYESAS